MARHIGSKWLDRLENIKTKKRKLESVDWWQSQFKLEKFEFKKNIVLGQPDLLSSLRSTKLAPKLQWLQEELHFDDKGLLNLIQRAPSILNHSITRSCEPKLNFYKMCMGEDEAVRLLQRNPSAFRFSLEKRLKPRLQQLEDLGIPIDGTVVRAMSTCTEKKWHARLERMKEENSSPWFGAVSDYTQVGLNSASS